MSDPIQKPVVVRNSLTVIGPIGAATLVTTGLATLASANIQGTAVVGTSLIVSGPVTGTSFSGIGTSLSALNASNLESGTVPIARLGTSGVAGATTFLRGDNSWSSVVTAVTVVAANGISGSIATQGTTPAITLTLGAITPTSINTAGSVTAASFSGSGASLTSLNGTNVSSGLINPARLGTGTPSSAFFLRGDGTWNSVVAIALQGSGLANTNAAMGSSVAVGTYAATAGVTWISSASATNGKSWQMWTTPSGNLFLGTLSDDGASNTVGVTFTRSALTVTNIAFAATTVTMNAAVSGTSFSGSGTGLTALNASNLASGTVPTARLASGTANNQTFLRGDGFWAVPSASGDISVTTVNSSGMGTFGSLSVNGATTLSTLSVNSTTTLASLTVNSNASFSAGFTANGSASIGGSLSVAGSLTTGDVTGTVFIPTSNTPPAYGVYEGSTVGGVGIATGGLERLSVSPSGVITQSGPVVSIINTLTSPVVDCSKGNYFKRTYTSAQTWSFINVPAGVFYSFILRITRSGSAAAQTWPSSVKWSGGAVPVLSNTNGGNDIFEFMTDDGGVSWRAFRRTTTTT